MKLRENVSSKGLSNVSLLFKIIDDLGSMFFISTIINLIEKYESH